MKDQIFKATEDWAKAIESREKANVLKMYHPDAFLWGTLSKDARHGHERINEYFDRFLQRELLQCEFKDRLTRLYGDFAFCSGYYEFSWKVADKRIIIAARFSFVYKKEGNDWLILEHHSSMFPNQTADMSSYVI